PAVALVFVAIDDFKSLNDTLGHLAGEGALGNVADRGRLAVRDNDLLARVGGEEFAIWMLHTPIEAGLEVAERVRRAVETGVWHWNSGTHPLTVSCGVASCPDTVKEVANLKGTADAALYRAKQAGRNRVERAQPAA